MKPSFFIFCALLAMLVTGCEQQTKEVAVVQQFSQIAQTWDDVIYVYGYADNYTVAEVIADHLTKFYSPRTYRIQTATISQREYERKKKQISTR